MNVLRVPSLLDTGTPQWAPTFDPSSVRNVRGYFAHKKTTTPLGPPCDPRHRPTVESQGGAFSYELTPVAPKRQIVSIQEQLLRRNLKRFRGGLVLKAHRLVYLSIVGWREMRRRKRNVKVNRIESGWRTGCARTGACSRRALHIACLATIICIDTCLCICLTYT